MSAIHQKEFVAISTRTVAITEGPCTESVDILSHDAQWKWNGMSVTLKSFILNNEVKITSHMHFPLHVLCIIS